MNTVVWIMVMIGHSVVTGPEFNSKEKCERAAATIIQSVNDRMTMGSARPAWCVRIEK